MLLLRELRSTSVQKGRLSNQITDESRIETWRDECQGKAKWNTKTPNVRRRRRRHPDTCTCLLAPSSPVSKPRLRQGHATDIRHRVQELGSEWILMLVLHRSHLHLRLAFRGSIRLADRELKRDYSSKLERESSTGQAFVRSDRAGFQARMSAYCRLTPAATTPTLHSPCLRSCLALFLFLFAPCSQFSPSPSSYSVIIL